MILRLALVLAVASAACSDDRGILVYVHAPDSNVSKIRLFVGTGAPTTKTLTIAGPHRVLDATYYTRDAHDGDDVVTVDGATVAKFAYVTSDNIPLVIAVGYDNDSQPVAAGVLHDLAAPTGSNQFIAYEVELAPDVNVFGTSGELQLGLWSRVADPAMDPYIAECAGIQVAGEPPYFVVRSDDQDCDGYTNDMDVECTPNTYNGSIAADPRKPTCLVASDPSAPPNGDPYCAIGGQPCTDGMGRSSGCAATHICVAAPVCDTCTDSFACAAQMTTSQIASTPHYDCSIPSDGTRLCGSTIVLERPATGGLGCTDFDIGTDGFGTAIESGDMKVSAAGGMDTVNPATSCNASLELNNGEIGSARSFTGITRFSLANNAAVALPILFEIQVAGCGNDSTPIACTIADDDPADAHLDIGVTQCAAAWGAPVPFPIMGTSGPVFAGATFASDGKEMFFADAQGLRRATLINNQIWATDGTAPSNFGALTNLRAPKLAADGLHLLFVANATSASSALYEVTRTSPSAPFGNVHSFVDTNAGETIESATYAPDRASLIIAASTATDLTPRLYSVPVNTVGALGPATILPVSMAATLSHDVQPSLSYDGLHLYFESDRSGNHAIYVSSRATIDGTFTRAVALPELAGASEVTFPSVSVDGNQMFYTTQMSLGVSLVTATRAPF